MGFYNSKEEEKKLYDGKGNYDWTAYSDRVGKELKLTFMTFLILGLFFGILFWIFVKFIA